MRTLGLLALLLALLLAAPAARGQGTDTTRARRDTARIAPVVVSATRTPLPRNAVPASVTVIDGAALRAAGITTLADALRLAPGIAVVQSGSAGAQASLFVRGGQNDYTKVLIDGVPVNDPGGALDLAFLTTDDVERIEVVRGPSSVVYGSDAVTGVIQIFTRRGAGTVDGAVDGRGGSYGSYDLDGRVGGGTPAANLSIGAARHASNGIYAFNSHYRNDIGDLSSTISPWRGASLHASGRYTDGLAHFPTDFTGAPVDRNAYRTETRTLIGADLGQRLSFGEGHLSVASNVGDASIIDPSDTVGGFTTTSRSHARRQTADAHLSMPTIVGELTMGGALEWQSYRSGGPAESRLGRAAYAELVSLAAPMTLALGARVDHSTPYGDFGTYRAAASHLFATGTRVRGSLGTAFREPSFLEAFDSPYSVANPSLRPERTTSWEAGVEQSIAADRVHLAVTYFHQRFVDLIDYRYAGDSSTYENIARARAAGVESEFRAPLTGHLTANASYTFLDTRVLRAGFDPSPLATLRAGGPLLRRPKHSGSVGALYRSNIGASLDVRATYVGRREDRLFSGAPDYGTRAVVLPPYTKLDLGAELPIVARTHPVLTATLRVDNGLNTRYQSVAGYATPGRMVLVGGRVQVR